MISVENSTFWGGIDPTPPEFSNNLVYWADQSINRLTLPISVGGSPTGGQSSLVSGDSFVFPNGTGKRDPFELTVTHDTWEDDAVAISGGSSGFLLSASAIALAESSTFSQISYESLGNDSPVDLLLFDLLGSPGFDDLGAAVWGLHGVFNDLPILTPSPVSDVRLTSVTPDSLTVEWDAASGPVTNYTVLTGSSAASLVPTASAGNTTSYTLKGLEPGETIYVSVQAWNGSRASGVSPATFSTTPDWTPGVPSGLTDSGVGPYSISLSWDTPTTGNVSNYTVLLTAQRGVVHTNFSVGVVTEYTVSGLVSGVEYTFQVQAWNASWTMGPGAPISVNTTSQDSQGSPPPATPPSAPSSPSSAGSTSSSHSLSLGDWIWILSVAGVILLGIVAPVAILSRLRAGRASR
jgi:hypothetical protein